MELSLCDEVAAIKTTAWIPELTEKLRLLEFLR